MKKTQHIQPVKKISGLFRTLSQPARLHILLAIGEREACVCHLEAALGLRQAYISQQLMALRKAGLVSARREGRNIYYRLRKIRLLPLLQDAAGLVASQSELLSHAIAGSRLEGCQCPLCSQPAWIDPSSIELAPAQVAQSQNKELLKAEV